MQTTAVKQLVEDLIKLHKLHLPYRTDHVLQALDINHEQNVDIEQQYSSASYSLFTQTAQKNGQMGEETLYSGLRANTPAATISILEIKDAVFSLIQKLRQGSPYAHYVVGVGDATGRTVNHYVSLFAYQEEDEILIHYFNPLPTQHYQQFLHITRNAVETGTQMAIEEARKNSENTDIRSRLIDHSTEMLQDNDIYCAEYASLYLYLSTLEYRIKHLELTADSPKTEHDMFFERLLPNALPNIIQKIAEEECTAYDIFAELVLVSRANHSRIESRLREMNLDFWAERVTGNELLRAIRILLDDIEDYYNDPTRTDIERFIVMMSVLAIFSGFYFHLVSLAVAGTATICYMGYYDLTIQNDLRMQREQFMTTLGQIFPEQVAIKLAH